MPPALEGNPNIDILTSGARNSYKYRPREKSPHNLAIVLLNRHVV